jgi:hypothetical protein
MVTAEVVFIVWYRRYRGVWPRGRAPKEIGKVMVAFVMGAVVVIGVVGMTLWAASRWIAAVVAFVVVTLAIVWYERAYAAAASRARARLG